MDYTQNLHLPQFAETDRIHHDDFNDAMSRIDAAVTAVETNGLKVVCGSWTGDGSSSRTVELGCTPKIMFVLGQYNGHTAIAVVIPGLAHIMHSDSVSKTTDYFTLSGSTVTISSAAWLNGSGVEQKFIAFC